MRQRCASRAIRTRVREAAMPDNPTLGPWLRRFLEEHVVTERNLDRNTQLSYRDTLALLLPFVSQKARRPVDRLTVRGPHCRAGARVFWHTSSTTAAAPLARAITAFLPSGHSPAMSPPGAPNRSNGAARSPLSHGKRLPRQPLATSKKHEIDALLAVSNTTTHQGRREYSILLFLYHSGARVSEAVQLRIGDVQLSGKGVGRSLVTLRGKGGKTRQCPLLQGSAESTGNLGCRARRRGGCVSKSARGSDHTLGDAANWSSAVRGPLPTRSRPSARSGSAHTRCATPQQLTCCGQGWT